MAAPPVGKRVQDVFAAYRAMPPGPKKRAMASRIIQANEALVQSTVDCLCGRKPLAGLRRPFGGCQGFDHLELDEAMQAGRIAFASALDKYRPEKGKFQFFLLLHTRYQLHKIEVWGHHLLHVPEQYAATERKHVTLFGEARDLENAADAAEVDGIDMGGVVELDGISPDDVDRWERTNSWPELEEWEAKRATDDDVVGVEVAVDDPEVEDTRTALEKFLDEELKFRTQARAPKRPLFNRWSFFSEENGTVADEVALASELQRRGVRRMTVRVPWNPLPVSGLAGVELLQSA